MSARFVEVSVGFTATCRSAIPIMASWNLQLQMENIQRAACILYR